MSTPTTPSPTAADCQITGPVGSIVQVSLAVLVAVVLCTEYLFEFIKARLKKQTARSFRTFWFDSYKICAGALVSHIFNIIVSVAIDELSTNADQCAIYALAFFYEATGVPFVQLLQYGVIQYALKMKSQSSSESNLSPKIDESCKQRWQYISKPGIYDANRYPVDDCLHCRSCQDDNTRRTYCKIGVVIVIAIGLSVLAAYIGFYAYISDLYIDASIGFLVCVFLLSTVIAPISSLWQTFQWVIVKLFEKSIWSLFAMAQAPVFATWSRSMSTGSTTLDAWLYIAIIPIIMNAFMFFMFSRISRLKLPCFAPKYNQKLEKQRADYESSLQQGTAPMLEENNSNSYINARFDKKEAFKVGVVFMLLINMTLLVIASSFLGFKGQLESIWILFLSMIIAPTLCSLIGIWFFALLIDKNIHLCCCCVDFKKVRKRSHSNRNGSINNKLSISLKVTDTESSD